MHEELWAGVGLKIQYAQFHLVEMQQSLVPPKLTTHQIVQLNAGAIIGNNWQQRFYPHFDAFLTAARSVPEIIRACFGADCGPPEMKDWFTDLDEEEKARRRRFDAAFKPLREKFRSHQLTKERDIVSHRTGVARVEAKISGFFGVIYTGDPLNPIPGTEPLGKSNSDNSA